MKISRLLHAVADYLSGIFLLLAPWLFQFEHVPSARLIAIIIGLMILMMSLLTRYEGGFQKIISMKNHLYVDVITGIFLATSPWVFNFYEEVSIPHLLIGCLAILFGLFTDKNSQEEEKQETLILKKYRYGKSKSISRR